MVMKLKANGSPAPASDLGQVQRAIATFVDPEHYVFLQSLPGAHWTCLPGNSASEIEGWIKTNAVGSGCYFGINPTVKVDRPTRIGDVVRRRWILIDIDRNKTLQPNDPATENEHEDAKELTFEVQSYLSEIGFPAPVQIDSGNGFHLYYRIDMPNDNDHRDLVHSFLKILDNSFSGDKGKIGHECFDARRISRMPGTWSRRGVASKERPYRQSKFVYSPKDIGIVPTELIRRVVEDDAKHEQAKVESTRNGTHHAETPSHSAFELKAKSSPTEDERNKAYGKRALEEETRKLATCPESGRHNQLVKSAYSLWELHFGGCLAAHEVVDGLFVAACQCGLDKDSGHGGEAGILKHIKDPNIVEKARQNPRRAPEDQQRTKSERKTESKQNDSVNWKIQIDDTTIAEGTPSSFNIPADDPGQQDRVFCMYTIGGMMVKEFPEPKWVIPGIMSEGLNLLAGKPKQGKSMLALNLALTIAAGGKALKEVQTNVGDILYLSLEDKARRVKARAINMLKKIGSSDAAYRLTIATDWPRQEQGGLAMIEYWYKRVEKPSLLIIDVWGMFKTPYRQGGSQYEQDGQQLGAVKRFVDNRGMSALVLMHCRKGPSEDVLEEVSGTMGITGAADGIIVLNRMRNDTEAKIFITGRDVPEKELALEFDKETFTWTSLGTMDQHIEGKLQGSVMDHMRSQRGIIVFCKQVADALDVPQDSVRKTLHRLKEKGFICQKGNGWLFPSESVTEDDVDEDASF